MLFLLLRIVFTVSFSHLLRFSQARTRLPLGAAAVNYVVAAAACGLWVLAARCGWHGRGALLGFLAGFTYVTSLLMILPAMQRSGVSVVGAVTQLSLMLPVAVAVWRFHEYPTWPQLAGILLAFVALPILSATSAVPGGQEGRRPLDLLTLLLFLSTGSSQVLMKEFTATCPPRALPLYSLALFAAAALFTLLWQGRTPTAQGPRPSAPGVPGEKMVSEWSVGLALGAANLLQLVFLLLALRALPAVIVFPVSAVLGVLANVFASLILWGERPPAAGWAGIGLAVLSVGLLSRR